MIHVGTRSGGGISSDVLQGGSEFGDCSVETSGWIVWLGLGGAEDFGLDGDVLAFYTCRPHGPRSSVFTAIRECGSYQYHIWLGNVVSNMPDVLYF